MPDPNYPEYSLTLEQQTVYNLKDYFSGLTLPQGYDTPVFNVGRFKADPTKKPVVEFLVGSPFDADSWKHERDKNGGQIAGGCAISRWYYRYTVNVIFFMTRTHEVQLEALTKARAFLQWIHWKCDQASVATLGLTTSDFGETPVLMNVISLKEHEGGGPPASYLLKATIYLEQLVTRRST